MFFAGVRISTLAMLPLFLYVSLRRDNPKPLLAAAAWMTGFESAYQLTNLAKGRRPPSAVVVTVARFGWHIHLPWQPILIGLGLVIVPVAWRLGLRPEPWLMAVVGVLWIVWIALGFHANQHTMVHFDAGSEAVNEAGKTLWAFAYLWPIWPRASRPETAVAQAERVRSGYYY